MAHLHRRAILGGVAALASAAPLGRAFAQAATPPAGPYKLDPLPYPADKNEPHIDAMTMQLHHGRHHAAFIANLNVAMKDHADLAAKPIRELLANLTSVPESIRTVIRNSGGGHANHSMFWQIMGGSGGEPTGDVKAAIDRDLGGFAKLAEDFNAAGGRIFGSGWVFVVADKAGKLALVTKPNQDSPLMDGNTPLFGNDVWEHAYYLKYNNRRPDYLKAWWNVVNWPKIEERYAAAKAGTLAI